MESIANLTVKFEMTFETVLPSCLGIVYMPEASFRQPIFQPPGPDKNTKSPARNVKNTYICDSFILQVHWFGKPRLAA